MRALPPAKRWFGLASLVLGACSNDIDISDKLEHAPLVTIQAPTDGSVFTELDGIDFVGDVEDQNGLSDIVTLEWASDRDGVLATIDDAGPDGDGITQFAATLSAGPHAITLTVVDSTDLQGVASVSVVVEDADYMPTAEITLPASFASFAPGEVIDLIGAVDDPNQSQETLTTSWEWQPEGGGARTVIATGAPSASGSAVSSWTDAPIGTHRLFLVVHDNDDNEAEDEVVIEVQDPNAGDADLDGWTTLQGDCNDEDPEMNPDFAEACDNKDNDCNGIVDDKDLDRDGHVDELCVAYLDVLPLDDCDDTVATVYPGAAEQGDGLDNDCNGAIDDGLSVFDNDGDCFCTAVTCTGSANPDCDVALLASGDCNDTDATLNPLDLDGDGASTCSGDCDDADVTLNPTDADGDGFSTCAQDCDDTNPVLSPDDVDNDGASACSGDCDDTNAQQNILDADSDGASTCAGDCNDGAGALNLLDADGDGFTSCAGDCNDNDASQVPVDGDGDGLTSCAGDCDDTNPALNQDDLDLDGFSTCSADCDDNDAVLNPGDVDSDGTSSCAGDCDDLSASLNLDDADADGTSSCAGDCNDTNPALNVDDADGDGASSCQQDCDDTSVLLNVDDADGDLFSTCDGDCDDNDVSVDPGDIDNDGVSSCAGDCVDTDGSVFPGAVEVPYNGDDDDCLGGDLVDVDGDGFDGTAVGGDDCNDTDANVSPGEPESCNGIDDDCDGKDDNNNAIGCTEYYLDADGDGYGSTSSRCQCAPNTSSGFEVTNDDDCYDDNGDVHPGQLTYFYDERGDGSWDYNCDGTQSKFDNRLATYTCDTYFDVFPPAEGCDYANGWETAGNPACGDTKNFFTGCFYQPIPPFDFCESLDQTPVDQRCR